METDVPADLAIFPPPPGLISTLWTSNPAGISLSGKQFPVFLHPKTSEEYALARVERKIGKGHKAFEFNTNEKVSLEEDLKRRDLTINAIAQDEKGKLIDPFNGISDIENRKATQAASVGFSTHSWGREKTIFG